MYVPKSLYLAVLAYLRKSCCDCSDGVAFYTKLKELSR